MANPASISAKHIAQTAKKSVEKALVAHKIPIDDYTFGFVPRPPHWWLGIIIRTDRTLPAADAQRLASQVHAGLVESLPGLHGGQASAISDGGHLTIGFAPPDPVLLQE